MSLLPIVYQLDPTGSNDNNKISNEPHTLEVRKIRAICPVHSPFFSDSIVIKDLLNNRLLDTSEYSFYSLQPLATAMYGKEIYNIILIKNEEVSPNVSISYQTLGGEYTKSADTTKELIDTLYSDKRNINWPNLKDVQSELDPVPHLHNLGDTIGFEYMVAAIERLKTTILTSSLLQNDIILKYLDNKLSFYQQLNDELNSALKIIDQENAGFINHLTDTSNPHQTTKEQIGLGNVENYSIAQLEDITQPDVNNPKYITNIVLKEYFLNSLNDYNSSVLNEINSINLLVNNITNELNINKETVTNLKNKQDLLNEVNLDILSLQQKLNEINSNLLIARSRTASITQRFLL